MTTALRSALVLAIAAGFVPSDLAHARRAPAPGGKVVVALPSGMVPAFVEAHASVPYVERAVGRDARARAFERPLDGAPGWRSALFSRVTRHESGKRWVLETELPTKPLATVLEACLVGAEGRRAWPADVVRAARLTATVTSEQRAVVVTFSKPLGPFVELVAGCALRGTPLAPYAPSDELTLSAQRTALEGVPTLIRIELRPDGESGDVVVARGGGAAIGGLVAPYADVMILVPSDDVRRSDPLRLLPPDGSLRAFHAELRPDLLVLTYSTGRGDRAAWLLPPGLAPARPLPDAPLAARPLPLTLAPLDENAPRLRVAARQESDPLVQGVVERLAVLLRTRGIAIEPVAAPSLSEGLAVVRWRPPCDDPALALLALAGQHEALHVGDAAPLLDDPRLLSPDVDLRMAGAIALERSWLEERRAVPLLYDELPYVVDVALHGVRLRSDGVPLLDDAAWSDGR